jgi:hypothetical protein
MELKSRSFTSKEPHVAREPQFADPCTSHLIAYVQFVEGTTINGNIPR